jgi:hypothetical protein
MFGALDLDETKRRAVAGVVTNMADALFFLLHGKN